MSNKLDAFVPDELEQLTVGFRSFPRGAVDRRADRTGADAVDANAERRNLLRDRFHH
jgi:hypothetical protein